MRRDTSRLFSGLANVLVAIGGALGMRALFGALTGKGGSVPVATADREVAPTTSGVYTASGRGAPSSEVYTAPATEASMHQSQGQATIYDTATATRPAAQPASSFPYPLPPLRPGWSRPKPEHIPTPTYAPSIMALSIVLILWGIISSYLISVIGLVLFFIALAGWIGELRHGH